MSVRQYKGDPNRWVIDVSLGYVDGKQKRYSKVFIGTKEQAYQKEMALIIATSKARKQKTPNTMRITDMAGDYLQYAQLRQSAKTYKDKKRMMFSAILPYFGNYFPDAICRQDIDQYQYKRKHEIQSKMAKGGMALINKELLCLSALIKWAHEHKLCSDLLTRYDKLKYERPLPLILSEDECIAFLKCADKFWRVLFLVMYQCGLRKDETLKLRRDQILLDNKLIIVHGKGNRERAVPMSEMLSVEIKSYLETIEGDYVFPNLKTGTPYTDIRRAIARIRKAAKITKRITPHLLRHSVGAHLISAGANLRTVQELFGHQDSKTTELYTQVSITSKRNIIDRLLVSNSNSHK